MKKEVKNLEELKEVAEGFLQTLADLPVKNTATVVGLSGDLGAGKTAFTKCIAAVLGINEAVTSPTFILEKIYSIPASVLGGRFSKLVHIDAYRLEGSRVLADGTRHDSAESEMGALGWQSLLEDSHNLIFLEWPEQVESVLPKDIIKISFEFVDEGVRSLKGELI